MTTLLVMTVGRTDVQLVTDGRRQEIDSLQCGRLHVDIARRQFRLVCAPADKISQSAGALPDGEVVLCTPKLDAVLAQFEPSVALVLETRRDEKSAPGDPQFAGELVEMRLRDRGVGIVYRVAYLTGDERLEDRSTPRDSILRREVVCRLQHAVRSTIEATRPSRVVVATTGGFPLVSRIVEEIVRLYSLVDVEGVEVPDGAKADPPSADRAVPRATVPDPLLSFQVRRRVLELVGAGNLLGAWAVAEPLHDDPFEHRWTRTVKWLACFASSLPVPDECDVLLLTHPRMAIRSALRVELALRAGDVPRAIHGTVAVFESALWDGLNERVERSDDPTRRRQFRLKNGEILSDDKLLRRSDGDGSAEDRKRPFELKDTIDGVHWYWIYDGDGGPAARLATRFLKRDALAAFDRSLGSEIRALRNDVAHNEPTPALMDDARSRMRAAGLWSNTDTFLSQPVVQAVLKELGEADPSTLLASLLDEVRRRLINADPGEVT